MIKAGFLIAYDYDFIFNSLPQIYTFVDEIVLAIDIDRKTWMGNDFQIEDDFFNKIRSIDADQKIKIYEDRFYVEGEKPMDLETRERNMLSNFMGDNCWKMQIDSDEYCLNFDKVITFLKKNEFLLKKTAPQINFLPIWITLFKQNEKGFFIIKPSTENFSMMFNRPEYKYARNSEGLDLKIDYKVIHQSWARTEAEVLTKIKNWGHAHDFEVMNFFEKWKALNEDNFNEYVDFHPIYKGFWQSLEFVEAKNITELLVKLTETTNVEEIKVSSKLKKLRLKNFLRF